jgi:hypothetical protein
MEHMGASYSGLHSLKVSHCSIPSPESVSGANSKIYGAHGVASYNGLHSLKVPSINYVCGVCIRSQVWSKERFVP